MLRDWTRSFHKDQNMAVTPEAQDKPFHPFLNHRPHTNNSFFTVAGLFLRHSSNILLESDSVKSPTSPLEFNLFSSLASSPFRTRKGWESSSKVGLSIVDSLDNGQESSNRSGPELDCQYIVFGPHLRIKTSSCRGRFDCRHTSKSLQKDSTIVPHKSSNKSIFEIADAVEVESKLNGEIRASSLGSSRHILYPLTAVPRSMGGGVYSRSNMSDDNTADPLSASDVELSDNHTAVITRCILEGQNTAASYLPPSKEMRGAKLPINCSHATFFLPSSHFLSFCYSCSKQLAGKDIYIYRGEKAFCSPSCRKLEMMGDEDMEEIDDTAPEKVNADPKMPIPPFEKGQTH